MKIKLKIILITIIIVILLLCTSCDTGSSIEVDPCIDGHNFSVTITASCTEAGQEVHECTVVNIL